jgi:hypothetical protein
VIATIALFAALGGGYAVAFSGSGSLQKGALKNIPPTTATPIVRSLTGVGSIHAACINSNPDDVRFYFLNNSGETLAIRGEGQGHTVPSGDISGDMGTDSTGQFVGHISPVDGTKAPQVSLQVSVFDTNDCTTSVIDVLALNTQQ